MSLFQTCVIVAPTPRQAADFSELVNLRRSCGVYPRELQFLVLSDPQGGRVGSGGALILAAAIVGDKLQGGERVLVINAGGESRRMPSYAPEGKLFAPLPLLTSSTVAPVVLDQQLSLFLKYPWNDGELVAASGDVVIDFDPEFLPSARGEVYGFAGSEPFEQGARHGVYRLSGNHAGVADYFQKAPADYLREHAALPGARSCAVDIGMVGFSAQSVQRLRQIAEARLRSGQRLADALRAGGLYIDLYVELIMACLPSVDLEAYCAKVREHSSLDRDSLSALHGCLSGVDLRAHLARRARFLHFGALSEYPASCVDLLRQQAIPFYASEEAELRPVLGGPVAALNCVDISWSAASSAEAVLVEGCTNVRLGELAGHNLIVGLRDRTMRFAVPRGICLDERAVEEGRFLLAYGIDDTFRPQPSWSALRFCSTDLPRWLTDRKLELDGIVPDRGPDGTFDLYRARLFCRDAQTEFVEGYWNPAVVDVAWRRSFLEAKRVSLAEINARDSVLERDRRRREIRTSLLRREILDGRGWLSAPLADFLSAFDQSDSVRLTELLSGGDGDLQRIYRRRLLSRVQGKEHPEDSIADLKVDYLSSQAAPVRLHRALKLDQIVWARSPIRLDLAGGWTDTPPYTLREGGEVVNLAVNLNDQPPVQVFCRPTEESVISINSIDTGAREVVSGFDSLGAYRTPNSPFALPKAAFCLLGLTPEQTGTRTLGEALERLGCGIELSLLCAVPKGSGLGTSSVLGATILAALQRFLGIPLELGALFRQVLQMEEMLTTGGGWQDQIGGVAGGVKYIVTRKGLKPSPAIFQLDSFLFVDPKMRPCWSLYYTGITRLAKNILQEVVDQANSMDPAYLFTLRSLKELARSARDVIGLRDGPALARVLSASWSANKLIHPSTTNDEVEDLLRSVDGLYSGMKLLGAGGGGYALFLSGSPEQADRLRAKLSSMETHRSRLVDMKLNLDGLQVSVS